MHDLVSNLALLVVSSQLVRYTVPPGDESGGEDAEDKDAESPPKKRAKAKPAGAWAHGSGTRGGEGAYGGLSLCWRGMKRGIRRRERIGRLQRPRAKRQRRRVRSSVHICIYICIHVIHVYSKSLCIHIRYVKFTVRRELEMTRVHNSLVVIILITLSDGDPKHSKAPYGA